MPQNGKIFCVLALGTILRYVIKENSRAEKVKPHTGVFYKKQQGEV